MRLTKELITTAYHEAGHVVADIHFGLGVISATIIPKGGILGSVKSRTNRSEIFDEEGGMIYEVKNFEKAFNYCKSLAAGYVAEEYYNGKASSKAAIGDFRKLSELSAEMNQTCEGSKACIRFTDFIFASVEEVFKREIIWDKVQNIAKALLEKETLNFEQIEYYYSLNDLYEKQKKEAEELGFSPIHPDEELDFSDTPPPKE